MDGAAQAPGQLGPEQGGDIGETQQPAWGQRQRLLQQPGRPPAAADAGQQGGRFAPRVEFTGPTEYVSPSLPVRSGQVAPAPQGRRMGLHRQAPALQHCDAPLQALQVVEGGAGRHQPHPIPRPQGRRLARAGGTIGPEGGRRHSQRPSTKASSNSAPSQTCWLKWRP